MSGKGPFHVAYFKSAAEAWLPRQQRLKTNFPNIHIIGVEGVDRIDGCCSQSRRPCALDHVDVFCDGTRCGKVGTYPQICADLVDEWMTVTNDKSPPEFNSCGSNCAAFRSLRAHGCGRDFEQSKVLEGKRVLSILCGANMDFEQLATIALRLQ